jgi:hypothetical protein
MFGAPLLAIDTTWWPNNSGPWTSSGSWDNGEPVDETFNVFIDDGDAAVTVRLDRSRTIGSLTVGEDDRLWFVDPPPTQPGFSLTSAGNILIAGSIEFRATVPETLEILDGSLIISATGRLHSVGPGSPNARRFLGNLTNHGIVLIDERLSLGKPGGV